MLELISISLKGCSSIATSLLITKQLFYPTFRPRGYPKYPHLFHFEFLLFLPCCSWGYFAAAVSHSSNNFHSSSSSSFHLASSLHRKGCDGVERVSFLISSSPRIDYFALSSRTCLDHTTEPLTAAFKQVYLFVSINTFQLLWHAVSAALIETLHM